VNCDYIARWYRWLEYIGFGGALEQRRFAFLTDVADAQRVLVLGEGDGRFLAAFVKQCKVEQKHPRKACFSIDYVDASVRMLELARRRAGTDDVTYHHADALEIPLPEAEYDLIVTHFFLDCLNDHDGTSLIERLSASIQPRGRWLISEFREPAWWARGIVAALYLFFKIATGLRTRRLIDHHALLSKKGFVLQKEETARFGLLASELWLFTGDNRSR
jgi:ubiquinone/menaquinone biosynthesis C-methylase UbiE